MSVPITDYKAIESHAFFQNVSKQVSVPMDFFAVPAIEGCHHRLGASVQPANVALRMNTDKVSFIIDVVTLVIAFFGSAVTDKMFNC